MLKKEKTRFHTPHPLAIVLLIGLLFFAAFKVYNPTGFAFRGGGQVFHVPQGSPQSTQTLPTGSVHVDADKNNPSSGQAITYYFPPGTTHLSYGDDKSYYIGAGTGYYHNSQYQGDPNHPVSSAIPQNMVHLSAGPDATKFVVISGPTYHVGPSPTNEPNPDFTSYIPKDWVHNGKYVDKTDPDYTHYGPDCPTGACYGYCVQILCWDSTHPGCGADGCCEPCSTPPVIKM